MHLKISVLIWMNVLLGIASAMPAGFAVMGKKEISSQGAYLLAPQWSPDGKFIAAAGKSYGSIWIYAVADTRWQKLVEQEGAGWDFSWSPDSRKIAYRANVKENRRKKTAIFTVEIGNQKIERITDFVRDLSTPRWPSTQRVSFLEAGALRQVAVAAPTADAALLKAAEEPVCLISGTGILIQQANRSPETPEILKGQTFHAAFSPDGATLLFEKTGSKIFTLKINSTQIQFIARGEMPAWSPDGKFIVYATPKDDGHQLLSADIFICDLDGGTPFQVTHTADAIELRPAWSPDGTKIVCDSNGKILLIDLEVE